jgi:glycerol kinase
VLDPYFSGTKIEWLLRHGGLPRGAACGTVDSWLVFKLTGEHVTDLTNASRTLLFDIHRREWDGELCDLLGVDPASLPEPRPSAEVYGETDGGVPVAGIAGDQQAALYGQACHEPGLGKNTYGTGSFVLQNAGGEAPEPAEGLLTTIAWGVAGRVDYAVEAAIFVTGAAVQWLRDALRIIAPPTRPRSSPARSTRTTACTWCPRSPASVRRTGTLTPVARSSASRAARGAPTWRVPRWSRWPTRPSTQCARWRRPPAWC